MDDRELEIRLSTHLHRRFDGATPPADLVAGVAQVFATETRRVTRPTLRIGQPSFGWTAVAAAVLIAVVALTGVHFDGVLGPGAPSPTPVVTFVPSAARQFMVLPPTAVIPSKADSEVAVEVLTNRLEALGILTSTSSTSFGIQFEMPAAGPTSELIRRVLGANGDIEFVPLPRADYDDAGVTAAIGKPLPIAEPALFGSDAIVTFAQGDAGERSIRVTLDYPATVAFADYTLKHSGETFAIVVDGTVAMLPVIREAIPGGQIDISGGDQGGDDFALVYAIMVTGGRLPVGWRDPYVPVVASQGSILAEIPHLDKLSPVESMDLQAMRVGGQWRAVWHVQLSGNISLYVDAETAQVIP